MSIETDKPYAPTHKDQRQAESWAARLGHNFEEEALVVGVEVIGLILDDPQMSHEKDEGNEAIELFDRLRAIKYEIELVDPNLVDPFLVALLIGLSTSSQGTQGPTEWKSLMERPSTQQRELFTDTLFKVYFDDINKNTRGKELMLT